MCLERFPGLKIKSSMLCGHKLPPKSPHSEILLQEQLQAHYEHAYTCELKCCMMLGLHIGGADCGVPG